MANHNKSGNCFSAKTYYNCKTCGAGNSCDVCHEHDEPRGDCASCGLCPECTRTPSDPESEAS